MSILAHQFRDLAFGLLAAFLQLLLKRHISTEIIVSHKLEDPHHEFTISAPPGLVVYHSWGSEEPTVFEHTTPLLLDNEVVRFLKVPSKTVSTAPQAWTTRMAACWADNRRWKQTRGRYRKEVMAKRAAIGTQMVHQAVTSWSREHRAIGTALQQVSWKSLATIVGTSTHQYTLLYRLKMHALRLWLKEREALACPHGGCVNQDPITSLHVFWDCPMAQQAWTWMQRFFALLQEEPVVHGVEGIFSFRMTYPPSKHMTFRSDWLSQNTNTNSDLTTDTISDVVNKYWGFAVALILTALWQARVDLIYNTSHRILTIEEVQARFERRLQAGFDLVACSFSLSAKKIGEWSAAMEIRKLLRQTPRYPLPRAPEHTVPGIYYVGFFDGGSRGNPGPGGSGSILLEVRASGNPRIVWINTVSLAGKGSTNNVAEFRGLYCLLHFIVQRRLQPVHIVGDSQLILRMMCERQRPKSRKPQHWYDRTRTLADSARIDSWRRHFRCHNKMADTLANLAMDSRRSQEDEPIANDEIDRRYPGITRHLENDFTHWKDSAGRQPPRDQAPRLSCSDALRRIYSHMLALAYLSPSRREQKGYVLFGYFAVTSNTIYHNN